MQNQTNLITITQNTTDYEAEALREQGRLHGHAHSCFTPVGSTRTASIRKDYCAVEYSHDNLPYLRIFTEASDTDGLTYAFAWEENISHDDSIVTAGNLNILVSPETMQYLEGATIDYKENVQGLDFVISNPNAQTTCVCPTPNFTTCNGS